MKNLLGLLSFYFVIIFGICWMMLYALDAELEHQEAKEQAYQEYVMKNKAD